MARSTSNQKLKLSSIDAVETQLTESQMEGFEAELEGMIDEMDADDEEATAGMPRQYPPFCHVPLMYSSY